jgi:hypothetical protein
MGSGEGYEQERLVRAKTKALVTAVRLPLEAVRGREQVDKVDAVGVHDRDTHGVGSVNLKDDLAAVWRPVRVDGVKSHVRDLA